MREQVLVKSALFRSALFKSILQNSLGLGLFAILTVALISTTYVFTEERITDQIRAFEARALVEILPVTSHDNSLIDTRVAIQSEDLLLNTSTKDAFVAFRDNKPVAAILPTTAPDGYSGRIELLVGIYADGTLAGVRAVNHKETPGLGDKINTNVTDWILSFTGKSLNQPKADRWHVRKDGGDFDQFAGATITPRAVVASVYRTLNYFAEHKESLFKQAETALPDPYSLITKEQPNGQ